MTGAKAQVMTIAQALNWASEQLQDGESPAVDSRALLCHVLDCDRTYLFTWSDKILNPQQFITFQTLVAQRVEGRPVAYLTGKRAFWNLELQVNESTLIPRPETELLIETALTLNLPDNANACDLGTGTGAIALALAAERPDWSVTGVDRIEAALTLAKSNASLNGNLPVNWRLSHWFDEFPVNERYHLIVTNPPYVESNSEYLLQGDVRFEPASALTAGIDGLDDIRHIICHAPNYLHDGGWLLIEHGYTQHDAIALLLSQRGFVHCQGVKDLNGLPRITLAQWQKA